MADDYLRLLRRPAAGDPSWTSTAGASSPGVTVLIPTYTAPTGGRTATLRICLSSVDAAVAGSDLAVALLVVDNGLSAEDARTVGDLLRATGRPHHILPAPRVGGRRYTAARARNVGLAFLAGQPAGSPLRRRWLLFLDDDTALAPSALDLLAGTLQARDRAVAACPRVVPVPDLAAALRDRDPRGGTGAPRRLPGALNGPGYDLVSVTSHGSLVTGRTVGLLVRQDPVLGWIRDRVPLFYEGTPFGSTEDMLAMAMLSLLGELWSVPSAEVVDEARKTPGDTRAQQFAWGYDHAWLARALTEAGALTPGVHALAWRGDGWEQGWADWGPHAGFLINPDELLLAYRMLRAIVADGAVAAAMFGAHAGKVRAGTPALGRVLRRWREGAGVASRRPRPDLPPLGSRDWAGLRDGMDSLVGHVAGNVAGSFDHAPYFLYGARQPAAHPRDWSKP
jgi:glycosyltransferase involved in cell wall biosynthesis